MPMSSYFSLLKKLYAVNFFGGVKLGLNNMVRLSEALGSPEKKFLTVHVAGTNGKGTVAAKIAKGLEGLFPSVGLYTSPHISSFRERIKINEAMISEEEMERHLALVFSESEKNAIPATFFELSTCLAFLHFAEKRVGIAVIETGLGGRLDATNIVHPLLSVITAIHLDHTDVLGNTQEAIAKEKAGIIKLGVPVVLGPAAQGVPVREGSKKIAVLGEYPTADEENRAIARAALEYLEVPEKSIRKGLTTRLPCRLEVVPCDGREIILDAAHNPEAIARLFRQLGVPNEQMRVICGFSKNKDWRACLETIAAHAAHIHLVAATNGRGTEPKEMERALKEIGVDAGRIWVYSSIDESVQEALRGSAKCDQKLLVCGTFFIMADVRQALGIQEPRDPFDLNEIYRTSAIVERAAYTQQ